MDPIVWLAVGATLLAVLLAWRLFVVSRRLKVVAASKQSMATRHGQAVEQFAPLLDQWPWDPARFRFLGSPIDGIQFTDEAVLLVEIKAAKSKLSPAQRRIRNQVSQGKVRWQEVRL